MKKLLVIVLLLVGCAGQKVAYYPDEDITRLWVYPVVQNVSQCLNYPIKLKVSKSYDKNAYADGNGNIILTKWDTKYWDKDTLSFIVAHEIAHDKLGHVAKVKNTSRAITGTMMIVNALIPGAGYLNYAVNPAVVNQYSKSMELEADKLASETAAKCLNIPIERQISIMKSTLSSGAGGFWSTHPSVEERIANITAPALP